MQAAVEAQNSASMAQIEFIKNVGLETVATDSSGNATETKVRMVEFNYSTVDGGVETTKSLKVPLLTMVSVPSLRIDEMTIDFNCKLNSVATSNDTQSLEIGASLNLNVWKVKLNVTASYKQTTSNSEKVERTYSMNVHVRVVNDEIPAGLDRILNILESEIRAASQNANGTSGSGSTSGT